ncbi:MAG: aminopeptidase [Polaromonas sp.]
MKPSLTALAVMTAGLLGSGCSSVGYYWQSVSGHVDIMNSARPVSDILADTQTPEGLRTRLEMSQRMRSFAVTTLSLPDNGSYHRYADLHRNAVVWNVVAAPPFSLKLKTWCFPVVGCVGYRGYFREADAQLEAARLKAEGLESSVYGVPAYSTLGWMNWAGGDPLLNTFINYPEGELARLIFHELAHQVVYAGGDTMFNESFATTVERLGSRRWLDSQSSEAARKQYAAFDRRRKDFRALAFATRRELAAVYGQPDTVNYQQNKPEAPVKRTSSATDLIAIEKSKALVMQRFRDNYARLKESWDGFSGYDPWVARANNASFGAQAAYDELVPGFEALFDREGRDWPRFYEAVRKLAKLPQEERHETLKAGVR